MPVTVVVGGQFGSEGKGKICSHLAMNYNVSAMVRCGSTNSGHTVFRGGKRYELRLIPAGFINEEVMLLIAPGALIDTQVLRQEVELTGVTRDRLLIDGNTGLIEPMDVEAEQSAALRDRLGSTLSGVGSAQARRVMRRSDFRTARDAPELAELAIVGDVSADLQRRLRNGQRIVLEGTQGYGLSLFHTPHFPFATSKDTTAAAFLSEAGLGPRWVDEVIVAGRTFPIRVGGHSGPLPNEISWEELQRLSGYPHPIAEYTTTTKRLRRVARFAPELLRRAVEANSGTAIALHGADYIDYRNLGATSFCDLTENAKTTIVGLEALIGVPVQFVGTGPEDENLIDRRAEACTSALPSTCWPFETLTGAPADFG